VTGAGDLPAGYVLHVVVQDERGAASRDRLRRSLVSAWQRAADWGMAQVAAPLLGVADGRLSLEESTALLAETFPGGAEGDGMELRIVVEAAAVQEQVEAIVRRKT
jgi:hypothetical protein